MARIRTATGISLGYDEVDEGGHRPIVFLHGVGSDKSVWRPQLDHFRGERRAVAFDYPGYGDSDPAYEGMTRDDYAATVLAAMTELGIEDAHVCGLSLGGVVAIAMHAAGRGASASLILADTFADHPDGQAIYERGDRGERRPRGPWRKAGSTCCLRSPPIRRCAAKWSRRWPRIDPAAYRIGAKAVWLADQPGRAEGDPRADARPVRRGGPHHAAGAVAGLANLIPGAQYEEIEGAGHISNLERRDEFNMFVDAFVRGVDWASEPVGSLYRRCGAHRQAAGAAARSRTGTRPTSARRSSMRWSSAPGSTPRRSTT